MYSVPIDHTAAERAQLLGELAAALKQAEDLLVNLEVSDDHRVISVDVHVRIQAARLEVDSLRRSRSLRPRTEFDPERTEPHSWLLDSFRS